MTIRRALEKAARKCEEIGLYGSNNRREGCMDCASAIRALDLSSLAPEAGENAELGRRLRELVNSGEIDVRSIMALFPNLKAAGQVEACDQTTQPSIAGPSAPAAPVGIWTRVGNGEGHLQFVDAAPPSGPTTCPETCDGAGVPDEGGCRACHEPPTRAAVPEPAADGRGEPLPGRD